MDFCILLISILLIFLFSTILRSIFGFGDALIAMPLLSLIVDLKVATPLFSLTALTVSSIILLQNFKDLQLKQIVRLIFATIIGIPIGIYILKEIDDTIIKLILGIVIILFSTYNLFKPNIKHVKKMCLPYFFGFIAGILGGAYNVNGPPVVFFASLKKWNPKTFRATLQGYFLCTGVLLVCSHLIVGNITYKILYYYVSIVPILLLGIFVGGKIHNKIKVEYFMIYVHIIMILLGCLLLVNSLI